MIRALMGRIKTRFALWIIRKTIWAIDHLDTTSDRMWVVVYSRFWMDRAEKMASTQPLNKILFDSAVFFGQALVNMRHKREKGA